MINYSQSRINNREQEVFMSLPKLSDAIAIFVVTMLEEVVACGVSMIEAAELLDSEIRAHPKKREFLTDVLRAWQARHPANRLVLDKSKNPDDMIRARFPDFELHDRHGNVRSTQGWTIPVAATTNNLTFPSIFRGGIQFRGVEYYAGYFSRAQNAYKKAALSSVQNALRSAAETPIHRHNTINEIQPAYSAFMQHLCMNELAGTNVPMVFPDLFWAPDGEDAKYGCRILKVSMGTHGRIFTLHHVKKWDPSLEKKTLDAAWKYLVGHQVTVFTVSK
ncbi:MAG: hypothetical protein NT003_00125 [Candidatus Magasanikbacteria bacterium]|nr:hypothetical protein [Candidatus Magasanikbacteria bacterium]